MFVGLILEAAIAAPKAVSTVKIATGLAIGSIGSAIGLAIAGVGATAKPTAKTDLNSVVNRLGYLPAGKKIVQEEIPPPFEGGQSPVLYRAWFQGAVIRNGEFQEWDEPPSPLGSASVIGSIQSFRLEVNGQPFDGLERVNWINSNTRTASMSYYATDGNGDEVLVLFRGSTSGLRFVDWRRVDGLPDTGGSLPPIQPEISEPINQTLELPVPQQTESLIETPAKISDLTSPKETSQPQSINNPVTQQPKINQQPITQPAELLLPDIVTQSQFIPVTNPNLPGFIPGTSPPRFLPDRVLPKTPTKPKSIPTNGLKIDKAPDNPNQVNLKKTPQRKPLPVPFPFVTTNVNCQQLKECLSGAELSLDPDNLLNVETEEIILKSPSCDESETNEKILNSSDLSLQVPSNLGQALQLLNNQLLLIQQYQCEQLPFVVGVPDNWFTKRATYPPQIVQKFRSEKINDRYFYKKISIPYPINTSPNYEIDIPAYRSGDYYLRIYFLDGSIFHIYVDSQLTAETIRDAILAKVIGTQLYDPLKTTIALKQGVGIAARNWMPIEKTYYAGGDSMKYQNLVWTRRFSDAP